MGALRGDRGLSGWWRTLAAAALGAVVAAGPATAGSAVGGDDPLPPSLARWFPPQAPAPVYLERMNGLGAAYSGIQVDLDEGDLDGALAGFDRFRERYAETAKMVPEWEVRFPRAPLDALGESLALRDRETSLERLRALRGVCSGCHRPYMLRVQQTFHWGNFGAIRARDPIAGAEVPFTALKWAMQDSLAGVATDAQQGQLERAREHFRGFEGRFDALRGTCGSCHGGEIPKYAGERVRSLVERMGELLARKAPASGEIESLVRSIDTESCFKCHLVHLPGARASRERP